MKAAEMLLALQSPVLEAEYHINHDEVLYPYDSYLPQLKEHLRTKTVSLNSKHVQKLAEAEKQKEDEIKAEYLSLKSENLLLKEKIQQQEKEFEIVHWYQKVMEEGIDTKQMLNYYINSKKTIEALERKHKSEMEEKNIELFKMTQKFEDIYDKYNDLKVEILSPLLQEVKIKDMILERQTNQ